MPRHAVICHAVGVTSRLRVRVTQAQAPSHVAVPGGYPRPDRDSDGVRVTTTYLIFSEQQQKNSEPSKFFQSALSAANIRNMTKMFENNVCNAE